MTVEAVAKEMTKNLITTAAQGFVDHIPSQLIHLGGGLDSVIHRYAQERHQSFEETEDWYTGCMLLQPSMAKLPDTKSYAGKDVIWLPGHHVYSREMIESANDVVYGPKVAPGERCKYMFIMDGPQAQDMKTAQYWTGAIRGFMYDNFEQFDIDISGCYVTGAHKFWQPYPRMSTIPAEWLKLGKKHLHLEIEQLNPEYIFVFGVRPLKTLLGNKAKVYSFANSFVEYNSQEQLIQPAKLMSFNEAYYMQRYKDKTTAGFHGALRVVAADVGTRDINDVGNYVVVSEEDHLRQVLADNDGAATIAMDCEWHGESPDRGDGELLTVQFSFRPRESFVVVAHSMTSGLRFSPNFATAINLLREWFARNPQAIILGQNFLSDMKWLAHWGLDLTERFAKEGADMIIAGNLLAEEDEHDLTAFTMRYTDMPRYDQTAQFMLDQPGMTHSQLPDWVLFPYAAADTDALQRMWPVMKGLLIEQHNFICSLMKIAPTDGLGGPVECEATGKPYVPSLWNRFRYITMPALKAIREIEYEGLRLDEARCDDLTAAYKLVCDKMLEELRDDVGDPGFNPNSQLQLRDLFFSDPHKVDHERPNLKRLGHTPLFTTGKRPKLWSQVVADREAWFEDGVGWRSKFWQPSLNDDTLGIFSDEYGCEISAKIRDYRLIKGLLSRLLVDPDEDSGEYEKGFRKYKDRDGRVRTSILPTTKTGRWRSFNPNLQNIPSSKEYDFSKAVSKYSSYLVHNGFNSTLTTVKSVFIPDYENWYYVEWDLQSAELWTAAYWADDPVFKEALNAKYANGEPISFHTSSMIKFFNLPYTVEEVDAIMSAGGVEGAKLKNWRTATKAVNFGVPYGRGGAAIQQQVQALGVDCTVDDAKGWIQGYANTFSVTWDKLQWAKAQVWDPGYLINPYGQVRHFQRVDDEMFMAAQEREAMNFPIQGTVAGHIDGSSVRFVEERDRRGMRTRLKLAIHDSLLALVPPDELVLANKVAKWALVDGPGCVVPGIGLRYGIDMTIYDRWGVKADPWNVYRDSAGAFDKRPSCKWCKEKIVSKEDRCEGRDANGKSIVVCKSCAK